MKMIVSKGVSVGPRGRAVTAIDAAAGSEDRTKLQFKRGHRMAMANISDDHFFVVESGCLICEVELRSGPRHVMLVLYPGDVFCRRFVAPLEDVRLAATMPSQVVRSSIAGKAASVRAMENLDAVIADAASRLLARSSLYATAMGRLSADERLTTLLADIALHLGKPAAGGFTFELPLSRRDMADHLALNPDSLSRVMSRLKVGGLLTMPTRTRAITRSLDALLALTPFGETLRQIHGTSGGKA